MTALAFSGFFGLAALVGFALAVDWVRHSPPIGVALVCLMTVPMWERPALFKSPVIEFAGASLYILDVVTLILFAAAMLQLRQLRANLRGWFSAWVLFGAVIAVAVLRVTAAEGVAGINSARWLLHFFWAMSFFMGVQPSRLRLHTISLITGWTLVLVAMYHGVIYGFGGAISRVSTGDDFVQTGRVLTAAQSLVLLLCAATAYLGEPSGSAKSRTRFYSFSALVFGGLVVIAQNRSVWLAAVTGTTAVLIWSARRRARQQLLIRLAFVAGVAIVVLNSGSLAGSQISESMSNSSTYEWRTNGWRILVSQAISRGPESFIFGNPSVSTFLREMSTGQTTLSAHNWYVDTFMYLGLAGLILLISILFSALVKSREKPATCAFVLAAVATYGWVYSVEWYAAPWLGAAITASFGPCPTADDPIPGSGLARKPGAQKLVRPRVGG